DHRLRRARHTSARHLEHARTRHIRIVLAAALADAASTQKETSMSTMRPQTRRRWCAARPGCRGAIHGPLVAVGVAAMLLGLSPSLPAAGPPTASATTAHGA